MANAANPIEVQKHLKGISYPASKDDIVRTARQEGADDSVLSALRALPDREYDGPNAVSQEISTNS